MKICIVDDEQNCIDNLLGQLTRYSDESGLDILFDTYTNPAAFIEKYSPDEYDIVFLDIYIGEMTGMDLAAKIREKAENKMIIFCTTSLSDMPQAFRYHAFEYIIKPAEYDRIKVVMDDAISLLPDLEKYIDLKSNKEQLHLALSSIVAVSTRGHYLDFIISKGDDFSFRMPLSDFKANVDDRFLLINKGVLVNMDYISAIQDKTCVLSDNNSFPIKIRESAAIKNQWQQYCINKIRKGQ